MVDIKKRILFRRIGVVLWISFVAACVATMVFFAMFDPETLGQVTTWPITLSRLQGYSIGFMLFWILTAATAAVTAFMLALPVEKLGRPSPADDGDTDIADE